MGKPAAKSEPATEQSPKNNSGAVGTEEIERKLIQTGRIEIAVEDFDAVQKNVEAAIESFKAIIVNSEFTGNPGISRQGNWVLKVEPAKFQPMVAQLVSFGRIVLHKTDSQDVTEEFFDLQARIKNLKAEEETLNRLLKENARTTQDVLEFRRNILQLRGDIERSEGRLNVLSRLTTLSTIHFGLKEEKAFEPVKKEADPKPLTYSERTGKSFSRAWKNLTEFLTELSEFAVEFLVWSPIIIPGVFLGLFLIRRLRRNAQTVLWDLKPEPESTIPVKSTLDYLSEAKEEEKPGA